MERRIGVGGGERGERSKERKVSTRVGDDGRGRRGCSEAGAGLRRMRWPSGFWSRALVYGTKGIVVGESAREAVEGRLPDVVLAGLLVLLARMSASRRLALEDMCVLAGALLVSPGLRRPEGVGG